MGVGQFGLLFWAMGSDISPGLASLVIQIQVFFTIFLSVLMFRERIRHYQTVALIVSFVGIFTIGLDSIQMVM